MRPRNVLVVGVGGQGVLLASNVLAAVCLRRGFDVKKSEVKGMAQRGGAVVSFLRYGEAVFSPLVERGRADLVVSLEWAEALRWAPYLRPGGVLAVDLVQILPPAAQLDHRTWRVAYPAVEVDRLREAGWDVRPYEASRQAADLGDVRMANVVLLGAVSRELEFTVEEWEEAIREVVPRKAVEPNLRAFHAGRALPVASVFPAPRPQAAPRRFRVEVTAGWCKGRGCGICVRVCPEDVLAFGPDDKAAAVDPDRCTGCQLCQLLCPDFAVVVREEVAALG